LLLLKVCFSISPEVLRTMDKVGCGRAAAHLRVANALGATELLPWTELPCSGIAERILVMLGSRPSRPVALFRNGSIFGKEAQVLPGEHVELTAVVGESLSEQDCETLIVRMTQIESWKADWLFATFSESARDDERVVLAAVRVNPDALQYASEFCKSDIPIVTEAVCRRGLVLEFASSACKNNKQLVMHAVRQNGDALEFASEACRRDREIVLEALEKCGCALQFAADAFKEDLDMVLVAIDEHPFAIRHASSRFKHDSRVVKTLALSINEMASVEADAVLPSNRSKMHAKMCRDCFRHARTFGGIHILTGIVRVQNHMRLLRAAWAVLKRHCIRAAILKRFQRTCAQ